MLKALKARTPPESKPVCAWSLPASQILEKTESDLSGFSLGDGGGGFGMVFGGVVALAVIGAGLGLGRR